MNNETIVLAFSIGCWTGFFVGAFSTLIGQTLGFRDVERMKRKLRETKEAQSSRTP